MRYEQALRWAEGHRDGGLRKAACDRLLGMDTTPVSSGKMDEYPDDAIVALLRKESVEPEIRRRLVEGWYDAKNEVEGVFEAVESKRVFNDDRCKAFGHVFRVPERIPDPALRAGVFGVLATAFDSANFLDGRTPKFPLQLQQVVAAAIMYKPSGNDSYLWRKALAIENVAAYAYRALLKIPSITTEIPILLADLILKQYREKWGVNVWVLFEYTKSALGSDDAIVDALASIKRHHSDVWEALETHAAEARLWPYDWVNRIERDINRSLAISNRLAPDEKMPLVFVIPSWGKDVSLFPGSDYEMDFLVSLVSSCAQHMKQVLESSKPDSHMDLQDAASVATRVAETRSVLDEIVRLELVRAKLKAID